MGPNRAVIYMGNGRRIECDVQSLNLEMDSDYGYDFMRDSMMSRPVYTRVEMTALVRKMVEDEEEDMCEKRCAIDGDCPTLREDDSLSTKYKNLDLDDNVRKLRKHGLVRLDGTLTEKGKDFLLNVLLDEYEDNVVEALEAVEESEEDKKSCK